MSIIPKHFGLSVREESYMFKELEKIRQKSKKECSEFKQKLAARLALAPSSEDDLEDQDQEAEPHSAQKKGKVSWAAKRPLPSSSRVQSPERAAKAYLQGALPSRRRGPVKPPPFRPRDFYLRSSAFLRHRVPSEPPAIARQAGTARPVVLLRPRSRLRRRLVRIRGEPVSRRVFIMSPSHEAPGIDVSRLRYRLASSLSSLGSEADESGRLRRLRIHTHFLREGVGLSRWIRPSSRSGREGSSTSQATWPLPVTRFIPTSIEEIIASLQSEAQLASDQTIKELIQSILGQNYDLTMEGISLMEQMYLRPSQGQTPNVEEEKKFHTDLKGQPITQSIYEELPEAVSSIFQIEQEDLLEWGAIEEENLEFKSQEMLEIVPQDSSKPLEASVPTTDKRKSRQSPLKVTSSESLQVRGKEVKPEQKSRPVKPLKPRKFVRYHQDKILIKKIPKVYPVSHLHDLCTTVPASELPVGLRLASRVCHTPDRTGHKTVLGLLGPSLLNDCSIDEHKDRILHGIPVTREKQKYISIPVAPPEEPPESMQTSQCQAPNLNLKLSGEEVSAYPGASKMFWNLTAPKFSIPESTMRETLYSKYESVQTSRILSEKLSESKESVVILDTYTRRSFKSLVIKKAASYENISSISSPPCTRLKKSKSTVEVWKERTPPPFIVKDDLHSNLKQLLYQKKKEMERQLARQRVTLEPSMQSSLETLQESDSMKFLSFSLVDASRKAGVSYIVYPRKKKKLWKKGLKSHKLALVYEQLSKPPKKLERFGSIFVACRKFYSSGTQFYNLIQYSYCNFSMGNMLKYVGIP